MTKWGKYLEDSRKINSLKSFIDVLTRLSWFLSGSSVTLLVTGNNGACMIVSSTVITLYIIMMFLHRKIKKLSWAIYEDYME